MMEPRRLLWRLGRGNTEGGGLSLPEPWRTHSMRTEPNRMSRPFTPRQIGRRRKELQSSGQSDEPAQERLTNISFICEATKKTIDYEIPRDAGKLRVLWAQSLRLSCRHCGQIHHFDFRSAFIENVLAADTLHGLMR